MGHAFGAEHLHGNRRAGFLDRLSALVHERAHATGEHAGDEVVSDFERAALHEHRCHGALARIQLRLHDGARRAPIGIRLEVEDFRLQQNGVEQLVDVRALLRGDLGRQRLTAEFLEHDTVRQ